MKSDSCVNNAAGRNLEAEYSREGLVAETSKGWKGPSRSTAYSSAGLRYTKSLKCPMMMQADAGVFNPLYAIQHIKSIIGIRQLSHDRFCNLGCSTWVRAFNGERCVGIRIGPFNRFVFWSFWRVPRNLQPHRCILRVK